GPDGHIRRAARGHGVSHGRRNPPAPRPRLDARLHPWTLSSAASKSNSASISRFNALRLLLLSKASYQRASAISKSNDRGETLTSLMSFRTKFSNSQPASLTARSSRISRVKLAVTRADRGELPQDSRRAVNWRLRTMRLASSG